MRRLFFITHADVAIDAKVPVPDWGLSDTGRTRHAKLAQCLPPVTSVWSSAERKAVEGADILARARGLTARRLAALHENDRSATGYLPPAEFEATADAFFARPQHSIRGWERAIDAQARVLAALRDVIAQAPNGDIAVIAHGGIGALLRAHVLGVSIDRSHDQPQGRGGGHVLAIALPDWSLHKDWSAF